MYDVYFQYFLEVKVDNVLLAEHEWDNVNVVELRGVKIMAAGSIYTPANAKISNLEYKSGENSILKVLFCPFNK